MRRDFDSVGRVRGAARGSLDGWVVALAVCAVTAASTPFPAQAEPGVVVVYMGDRARANEAQRERMEHHVERAAEDRGDRIVDDVVDDVRRELATQGPVDPARVRGIVEVESLLAQARTAASMLDERAALGALHRAVAVCEAHADVPGSAAWLAEAEATFGLVAAQAGRPDLADPALAQAALLDPSRALRAAEASPEVVARARALAAQARPFGRFEVRASAPDAQVYLDDQPIGLAPQTIRTRVGRHVVRIEAPGHVGYGRVIDVFEGNLAPLDVVLSEDPAIGAARAFADVVRDVRVGGLASSLRALSAAGSSVREVWLVEVGPAERAIFVPCDASGCGAPQRLEREDAPRVGAIVAERDESAITRARNWVREPPEHGDGGTTEPTTPWYDHWYVWAIAGAVVTAGVTTTVILALPEPDRDLRLHVSFDGLTPTDQVPAEDPP